MSRGAPPRERWVRALDARALAAKGRVALRLVGRQVALFHTPDGVRACDNRCPHEGYPLVEGSLDGACLLTCNWHNWKFDLADGRNMLGGDRLRVYPVEMREGAVWVDLAEPQPAARRAAVRKALREAFADEDYTRLAREIARYRAAGGDPVDALRSAVRWSHDRHEFGWTHAYAGAADWLALYDEAGGMEGDAEIGLVCLTEAVGHIAHDALRHRRHPYAKGAAPFAENRFATAVEAEDEGAATALTRGGLAAGLGAGELERAFARAALAHYNDFGHALIYAVKAGRLVERLGRRSAEPLLLALARSLVYARREDLIPEFRAYAPALAEWQASPAGPVCDTPTAEEYRDLAVAPAIGLTLDRRGVGPVPLYRALLAANAAHMLTFDLGVQARTDGPIGANVGWLDFTHALTFANAVRVTCEKFPDLWPPGLLQLACFAGRNAAFTDPGMATEEWRVADSEAFFAATVDRVLDHGVGEYIHSVHLLKTALAVREEVRADPDGPAAPLLLAALNRLFHAPLKRKHPRRAAHQALDFVAKEG